MIEGLGSIFGEFLYDYYGVSKEQKLMSLIKEACTSLLIGSFLGITFDLLYVFFFTLFLFVVFALTCDKQSCLCYFSDQLKPIFSATSMDLTSFNYILPCIS